MARSQLARSRRSCHNIIMTQRQRGKPNILSPDYIVGLTDGEGCFYLNVRPEGIPRSQREPLELHFYIKLRGDHLGLLKKVKSAFGCGKIYIQSESRANHSQCYRFEINSQKEIFGVLIPFFDKYPLQGPKVKSYKVFREAAMIMKSKEHLTDGGLLKLRKLKVKLNSGARRVWKIRLLGGNAKKC